MGRPLNSKFFGNDTNKLLVTEAWMNGSAAAEACSIVRQRSNLIYEVQAEVAESSATLTIGSRYLIVALGSADFTTVGAASNTVGTVFTATGTNAGAGGTAAERDFCKLQAAAPTAPGECRIEIQPENATTPAEATFTFSTNGTGNVSAVTLTNGGYGYWTPGATFNITVASDAGYAAGTEAVVTIETVANGSITSVSFTAGAGYSNNIASDPIVAADVLNPDANPPVQYARIINAHQVKCFPQVGGNTFAWPITDPTGGVTPGGFRGIFSEADIDTQ